MKLQLIASTLLLSATVLADEGYHYYTDAELTVMACKYTIYNTAKFCAKDSASTYACPCGGNQPALGSLLNCMYDQFGENNTEVDDILIEYCAEANKTMTPEKLHKAYENVTRYLQDPTKIEGFNSTEIINYPVIYNSKVYNNSFRSLKVRWRNISNSMFMGAGLIGYWGVILIIGTVYNFLVKFGFVQQYFHSRFINKIRKHVTFASLFPNKQHTRPLEFLKIFGGIIPTRIQSIVLFFYFVLMFVFIGIEYQYVEHNTIWKTVGGQRARYPGDRSGILLVYSLQLTYLFSGRNNFMIWLTGWKLSTFYTYHKWISRFNFIMALIHTGAMYVQSYSINKLASRSKTGWYRAGIAAMVFMGLMVFFASYKFRKVSYETFLIVHLILGGGFLATSWVHSQKFQYQNFFYALIAIWAFDRIARIVRLVIFGVQKAKVTVVSDEILKIVIPKRKLWKAYPGSFGYIHFLQGNTFFQSHPFTIVETHSNEIVFYSKIKGGVTSATHTYLNQLPDKTGTINVSVEGPYGRAVVLKKYDTVLFYAGGTGISTPYAHILKLLETKTTQQIELVWTIKTLKSLDWFKEELVKLRDTSVKVIIYITRHDGSSLSISEKSSDSDSLPTGEKNNEADVDTDSLKDFAFVEFRIGRPNIEELVKSGIEESEGNVAVLTTAHNSLVDDVRNSVANNLNSAKGRVDYFEDLQIW